MSISEQSFRQLLERYLNGSATPEERELLDRFFDSYKSEPNGQVFIPDEAKLNDEILRAIHSRFDLPEKKQSTRVWLAVAAVIPLFLLAWFFIDANTFSRQESNVAQPMKEEHSAAGQKLVARLPDGTTVSLNGDTKITYPAQFSGASRDVTVSGEAFFEVVHDTKPFIVHLGSVRTEVLGTSFNVKRRGESNTQITLVSGKVNVVSSSGESILLKPNEQAVFDMSTNAIISKAVDVARFTSWKDNILFFEQTTLAEAVRDLENWYGVKIDIVTPAISKCVITAKYQNEPLGNVLSSFQFLLNLEIRRLNEGHYALQGKGCK